MSSETATVFPAKKIATKVKHHILQSYLNAWGGIIITSNQGRQIRLAFVDTCCGSGLYEAGNDVEANGEYDAGSALIGINALDELLSSGRSRGSNVSAKALFINEKPTELDTLSTAIGQYFGNRIPFETLPQRLEHVVPDVGAFCDNHFAVVFIDPYGPSAIPFSVVSKLVSLARADYLINFPYYSIHKWIGWLDSGEQESRLARVDQLLNGQEWREIARDNRHDPAALEQAILDHYMDLLGSLGVAVMAVRMTFEDCNRTMYHLLFTSRNTAGLAAAKKRLQDGEAYQAALKAELRASKQHQSLFDFMAVDAPPQDPVDVESLARDIRSHFKGRSVTRDEVIRYGLFKPDVLDSHVTKALTRLKQAKVAFPSGTKYRDTIKFAS